MPPPFDAEAEMRRHGSALRGLANALLRDPAAAEDAVQGAWLASLERPPRDGRSPGGWLTAVVRTLALRWQRGERRRRRREDAAAPRDAAADAASIVEREELLQCVVDALRSLPQPYRETVWLRYFEGLTPTDIAARSAVPLATVKSRLHRGLALLRTQLDAGTGDGEWRRGLAAAFGAGPALATLPAAGAIGVMMMAKGKLITTFGVLLVLAAVATWWSLVPDGAKSPPSRDDGHATVATAGQRTGDEATTTPAAPQREAVLTPEAAAPASTGTLLIRALDANREPATNQALVLTRRDEPLFELRQRTDEAGAARFDDLAPGNVQVHLLQNPERTPAAIESGEVTELELELPAGLAVRGRVIDAGGAPVAGAEVDLLEFNESSAVAVTTTDADGRFAIEHAQLASMVGARTARHAMSRWQMLRGARGGTTDVVIQLFDPGGVVEGMVLDPQGRPVAGAHVTVGKSAFEGPFTSAGIEGTAVPVRTDAAGRFRALGLAASEQPVEVRAAGFVPWRGRCFVDAGATTAVVVDLAAGVTCSGVVRDASGAVVAGANVRPRGLDGAAWFWTFTDGDGAFVLAGIPPGEIELRAEHRAHGKDRVTLTAAAGETVRCEFALSRGIELSGRVLDEAGSPLAGIYVWAVSQAGGGSAAEGRTGADGRFVLANCAEGLLRITAMRGSREVRREQVDPRLGDVELRLAVEPVKPASVHVRGQLFGPDGRAVAGAAVVVHDGRGEGRGEQATDAGGKFDLGPLPPGTWHLYVPAQRHPSVGLGPRELADGEHWDVGRIDLVAGGTATVHVSGAPAGVRPQFAFRNADRRPFGGQWLSDERLRTDVLAPGDYVVQVWCDGFTRRPVPFAIRAGEETKVDVRLERGIRQRLEYVRADGMKVSSNASHSLFRGDEVLIDRHVVHWFDAPTYGPDGAMTAELWLAPGSYRLEAKDDGVAAVATFTVGEREGAPVRVVLR